MAELACSECSAPLQVQYRPKGDQTGPGAPTPLRDERAAITLGEGDTPSVRLRSVGQLLGIRNLYGKLELTNPTGSFKDRGSSVMVSVAREQGVLELVEDSSGNAGASVAAYAARAGIRAHIFAPASASEAKLRQIRAYGADVHQIEGSREDTATAAVDYCRVHALPYASHAVSPYFLEGTSRRLHQPMRRKRGLQSQARAPWRAASRWARRLGRSRSSMRCETPMESP